MPEFKKTITVTVVILADDEDEATDSLPDATTWQYWEMTDDTDEWQEVK